MSTLQRKLGAQILEYPSVFTVPTGKAHWEVLLRARAIENQCYVIAAAQVGKHNDKRSSYGHSMVIDPWGKVLADCKEESPSYRVVEIDLDYLNEVRGSMPILNSIRSDIYLDLPLVRSIIILFFITDAL
jgi:predicted amidohydrolase